MTSVLSPDEATQRDQVRRTLDVMIAGACLSAVLMGATAVATANGGYGAIAIILVGFAVLTVVWPRRILADGRIESAVTVMALAGIGVVLGSALITPSGPLIVAILLIPITAAVPYVEVRSLLWLMIVAWVATVGAAAASLLPGAQAAPAAGLGELWGAAIVSGLVLFLLYLSSEKLKASSREFSRLFRLSSDLADATEPGILGDLVARHLAEATGMDDCVIYALGADTHRLTPFGSHPAERSLLTEAETMDRPILRRVIEERARVILDAATEADPAERARMSAMGRKITVLLPLVARTEPVGVAELTSAQRRPIDERRLALARTLAFEAAMAIENGRLYHELHERSLHDPLTGLANRSLFFDRVEHAIARLRRASGSTVAVLYLDLDNFKTVNDTLGHARGDRVLAITAERLLSVVRAVDTVARLGGDEFAVLLEDLSSAQAALVVAERAMRLLEAPFELAGQSVMVGASIGVAVRSDGAIDAADLIQEADASMYEAKRAGKGVVRLSRRADLRPPTTSVKR